MVSNCFVKHDTKGVLKYRGRNLHPHRRDTQWAISIGHVDMTYFMLKSQFFHRNRSFYSSEIVTDEKKAKSKKKIF